MTDITTRLSTALADRYRIESHLGEGGMANVYLAHDLKHDRRVAVKVLRPELAAVLGAERFVQEIKTTANLQHPHILPLFDSGEADSFLYYVMPYIDGETLRDKLNRETQLGIDEAVSITTAIADALDYAHRQNVIHRDIKPENILLQDGRPMVADFGIAIAVSDVEAERLTKTGISLGTPAYMSPEQVSGDQSLDARSDLYSVACVVYEMLAGDPPFVASTAQAVMARHMADTPPPLTTVRSSVDMSVANAVAQALSKARADRYDTVTAFAQALSAPAARVETQSIVVSPFANLSPDPDNEYFSDGLTDEITTDLSKVRLLRVISRNSAMPFKGTTKDSKTIGRELNVRYLLQGSVRRAGDSLRVTAQLIDAASDAHLWADKYTGTVEDVFDIQEKLSRTIVEALGVVLSPEEGERMAERPIRDVHAYECYHRASLEALRGTDGWFTRALRLLENGLAITGPNALLYAGLARHHFMYSMSFEGVDDAHLASGKEYASKAQQLDPDSAHTHAITGWSTYKCQGDVQQAVGELKRALAIDPDNMDALWLLSWLYLIAGRTAAARPVAETLVQVDPLTPYNYWVLAFVPFWDGRFEDALEPVRTYFDMDPESLYARWAMFYFHAWAGRFEEGTVLLSLWSGTNRKPVLPDLPSFSDMPSRVKRRLR